MFIMYALILAVGLSVVYQIYEYSQNFADENIYVALILDLASLVYFSIAYQVDEYSQDGVVST